MLPGEKSISRRACRGVRTLGGVAGAGGRGHTRGWYEWCTEMKFGKIRWMGGREGGRYTREACMTHRSGFFFFSLFFVWSPSIRTICGRTSRVHSRNNSTATPVRTSRSYSEEYETVRWTILLRENGRHASENEGMRWEEKSKGIKRRTENWMDRSA